MDNGIWNQMPSAWVPPEMDAEARDMLADLASWRVLATLYNYVPDFVDCDCLDIASGEVTESDVARMFEPYGA